MIGGKSETSSDVEMARVPLGRFHGDLRDLARIWLRLAAQASVGGQGSEIAPEPTGHGLPLSKCEAYNRVYDQRSRSS
jgi:hypothetical protein